MTEEGRDANAGHCFWALDASTTAALTTATGAAAARWTKRLERRAFCPLSNACATLATPALGASSSIRGRGLRAQGCDAKTAACAGRRMFA